MSEMPLASKLFWLCLAGAAGTLARYFLSGIVQRIHSYDFPWGTLAVNAMGIPLVFTGLALGRIF